MMRLLTAWILLAASHILCFWFLTEPRYSSRKTALIYSVFFVAFVCLIMITYCAFGDSMRSYAVGFMVTITASMAIFMWVSADSACKKMFLFISYANVFCMLVCISIMLCRVFFRGASETVMYYARNIIRTVLYIPTSFLYLRFLRPYVRAVSGNRRKTWYSISTVSVLFLAVFALFVVLFNSAPGNVNRYIPFFLITAFIYISVLWVIFGTVRSMLDENRTELINQNVAYLREQLESAREHELTEKTVRHDFRHHNQNIESMLEKGEVGEALRYLKQYNNSLDAVKINDFCQNITVNAILNSFSSKARKNGISFSVEADTVEDTAISDMDYVAVLSNLLENAVNGCIECGSKGTIKANIRTVADKTVIVCSNPCKDKISIENNMIKNRGIGIASILSAIRKYDGDIKYCCEDGVLTACVIMNS